MSGAVGHSLFRCLRFAGEFAFSSLYDHSPNRRCIKVLHGRLSNDDAIGLFRFSYRKSIDFRMIRGAYKSENSVLFRNSVNAIVCDFVTSRCPPPHDAARRLANRVIDCDSNPIAGPKNCPNESTAIRSTTSFPCGRTTLKAG